MKTKHIREFLRQIPKTDLHVHLDGSLRLQTLIDLAKQDKIKLPSYTIEGLKKTVFKGQYKNLVDFLKGFPYTCAVLQNAENLERIAYELALDNIEENVRYLEVRYAPQLHINKNLPSIEKTIKAVYKGLEKARKEHEKSSQVRSGKDIPFKYGIIVGAMRCFNEHLSFYHASLIKSMPHFPLKKIFGIASLDLAVAAVKTRNEEEIPVVGFDLCGAEAGYPPIDHHDAYKYVHKNFMGKTVHAGEAYGPESIFQAITECHTNRIGHGTFLYEPTAIKDPEIENPEKFANSLSEYIASRRITIEVCPTSNLQTIPTLKRMKNHPIKKMIEHRLSVTVCTDNRLMSDTNVTQELTSIIENIPVTKKQLRDIVIAGFKGCFYPGPYVEHRNFVRTVLNKYFEVENKLLKDIGENESIL